MRYAYSSWPRRSLAALGVLLATAGAAQAQNPAPTFAPAATYGTGGISPLSIAAADVNGDGKPDLLTVNFNSNTAGVLLGNGNGTFQAATTYGTGGGDSRRIAVADVNGDGKPDLLTANESTNNISVLLGNGNGTFQAATTYGTGSGSIPDGVAAADVNGDGKPDLLTANYGSNTAGVLLGNGNGTFQPATTYSTGSSSGPRSLAVADVNGDGKLDLLTGNYGSNTAGVLLGNGNGTFQPATTYGTGSGSNPFGIAVADVNGDGKPDLLTANSSSGTVGVLLGNGTGSFQAVTPYGKGILSAPYSIAVADVNGDGKLDALTATPSTNNASVLLGYGTGYFQAVPAFGTGANSQPFGLAVADVNGDGKPDLLTANESTDNISVLLNTTMYAPTLTSLSPDSGPVGGSVTLTGTNLAGATVVRFNGTAAATFAVVNATTITATVPLGATSGPLTVTTPSGTSGGVAFTVTSVPTVTTAVTNVTSNSTTLASAVLGGVVTSDGNAAVTDRGVVYSSTNTAPTIGGAGVIRDGNGAGTGSFTRLFTTLTPGTTYTARAYATNSAGTSYGTAISFTTLVSTQVVSIRRAPINAVSVRYAVTFAAPVTGLSYYNFSLTTSGISSAVVSAVLGSGTTYTVDVIAGAGRGTLRLDLVNTIGLSTGLTNIPFAGEVYTLDDRAPTVPRPIPSTGPVGTSVTITGTNLAGTTAVSFNGTPASSFVVNSPTSLTAVVAAGTTTGPVSVTTSYGTAASTIPFVVRVAPTTVADSYATPQGITLMGNVLSNDLGTNPRAILINRPANGTLVLNPDGSFSYQPNAGFTGQDSFTYYACDPAEPLLCGNPVTVTISVTRTGPVTVADSYTTPAGTPLTGNVLANDLGTNPRAILITRTSNGTLVLNPDGSFRYVPNAGFVGSDSFTYYACNMGSPLVCGDPATVSITVTPATIATRVATQSTEATATTPARSTTSAVGGATSALALTLAGHPNPFGDALQLSFALPLAQAYTLAVYDAQGRLVQQLASGQAEAGQAQTLAVPTQGYAAGLYLVRLSTSTGTQLLKLIKQ
ncbi:MAG TPA: FG-GAP-like repeat-containing protein [Hymenobacter sp.]|uniref:beta strand repeat-containing protein n=1 Tax=Hymenobacter sp. TaxID=1898978 RepID=UPI002D7F9B61|nr:FG-GAP-like repeat-containing protein [Hymenobacter sp.]HET9505096.1 FG-GAP-like repeat-containing protein [Hymenobacter sp.]